MINIKAWLIVSLIIASLAAVGILAYENKSLTGDNNLLTVERNAAQAQVNAQQEIITQITTREKENQAAHSKLIAQLSTTKNLLTKHEQTIRTLEQENEQIKAWSNTRLPDPVISLRQHPTFTGSQDYRNWLSERDTLPITSLQPTN
jgi:LysB family phage lysis regulatory protein